MRTALVVDDSMLIRHSVCRYLEERGFVVESACNGEEALEMVGTVLPDVIITDVMMPKMDGTELIRRLKGDPQTAGIPVVVLSGRRTQGTEAERQANFVIYKDIEIDVQLAKALKAALGERAAVEQL